MINPVVRDITYINKNNQCVKTKLYYIDYKDFKNLKNSIDNEFLDICSGDSGYDLTCEKREILSTIINKPEKTKYGLVAEFFAHLFLRNIGYSQHCLYRNLEDRSVKKGFDGLYVTENIFWLMESKSAYTPCFHKNKINEAINCVKEKVEIESQVNPWRNAINHIKNIQDEKQNKSIKKQVQKLSYEYQKGVTHNISEFNIIPVSTLFVENIQQIDEIAKDIVGVLAGKIFREIIIVCIDNKLFDEFLNYLRS